MCTLLLGCALTTLINISLLWTISGEGAVILLTSLVTFLSGMIVPLPLFPDWAQPIVQASRSPGSSICRSACSPATFRPVPRVSVLQHQLLWTVALVLFGRWLLSQGLRRVVVQGG